LLGTLPFRYRLTIILVAMIVLLVATLDFISLRNIELRFRTLIDNNLQQTQGLVDQRLGDGYDQLYASGVIAADLKLVYDLLVDSGLSDATRNDMVSEELLPSLIGIDFMGVVDGDGQWRGVNDIDEAVNVSFSTLLEQLPSHSVLSQVLEGEASVGHLFIGGTMIQVVAIPVFIGEQMLGAVLLGKHFSQVHLDEISQTVDAVVGLIEQQTLVMSSSWPAQESFSRRLQNLGEEAMFTHNATLQVVLMGERYLIRHTTDENRFFPDYLVAKSLDAELLFVDGIRATTLWVSGLGVLVALLLSLLVAAGIAKPLERLRLATREVADENFSHRVPIKGADEFSALGLAFNNMMQGLEEKQVIRDALDKSVSREIASHLLDHGAVLGGESLDSSVLFADIRGFTELSERLTESQLIELLNRYFSKMNVCILSHDGVIDKFIGDAIMAIFGAPIKTPDHALSALTAALDMIVALDDFNNDIGERYGCQLRIGVGINTGRVVAGVVGSPDRMNYTVLGDQVNIASRIEGLSKYYGVSLIITEATLQELPAKEIEGQWTFRYLDRVQVKGRSTGLAVYEPLIRGEAVDGMVASYDRAMVAIMSEHFGEALEVLSTLLSLYPNDRASELLRTRCEGYLKNPELFSREYQSGVRIFDHK